MRQEDDDPRELVDGDGALASVGDLQHHDEEHLAEREEHGRPRTPSLPSRRTAG